MANERTKISFWATGYPIDGPFDVEYQNLVPVQQGEGGYIEEQLSAARLAISRLETQATFVSKLLTADGVTKYKFTSSYRSAGNEVTDTITFYTKDGRCTYIAVEGDSALDIRLDILLRAE